MSKARDEKCNEFLNASLPVLFKALDAANIIYSDEQLGLMGEDSFKAGWDSRDSELESWKQECERLAEALEKIKKGAGKSYTINAITDKALSQHEVFKQLRGE